MSKKEMINDIKFEMENLERLNKEMKDLLAKIGEEPTFIEIRAASSILGDFYSGVEKIFEKIATSIDKNLPQDKNWHNFTISGQAPNSENYILMEMIGMLTLISCQENQ